MKIAIVHPNRVMRQVLARALGSKTQAEIVDFSCFENLLVSAMDYDVFVLYNIFGRDRMDRWDGVKWLRYFKPEAVIISAIHHRFFDRKSAPPGADAVLLCVGSETGQMIKVINRHEKGKSYVIVSGYESEQGMR